MSRRLSIGGASRRKSGGRLSVGSAAKEAGEGGSRGPRRHGRRKSFGTPLMSPSASMGAASTAQVAQMYANVLKMSTENKINAKNTWSLTLIDQLDNVLEQQQAEETGTDFQKASCTLDASIKIYAYRVDDVWSTSYRVLENLNRTGDKKREEVKAAADKGASRKIGATNTLETNPAAITVRNFDLEWDVDPLFHRMSKAFDEGGARGMLLNHLGVHSGCDMAFDSVDVADVDAMPEVVPERATKEERFGGDAADALVDALAAACAAADGVSMCPPLETLYGDLATAQSRLENATDAVSHGATEGTKPANGTDDTYAPAFSSDDDDDDDGYDGGVFFSGSALAAMQSPEGHAALARERHLRKSLGGAPAATLDGDGPAVAAGSFAGDAEHTDEVGVLDFAAFDGGADSMDASVDAGGRFSHAARPSSAAFMAGAAAVLPATGKASEYAFFDTERLAALQSSHWAGPGHAHWKTRPRAAKSNAAAATAAAADGATGAAKSKRGKRKVFSIDFSDTGSFDAAKAFAPPPRSATSTQMSAAALKRAAGDEDAYLLPPDIHYNVKELTKLFLRPESMILPNADAGCAGSARGSLGGGFDVGADDDDDAGFGGFGDSSGDLGDATFFAMPGTAEAEQIAASAKVGGGVQLAEARHKVERVDIAYARTAKKVDVRRLKENIWSHVESTSAKAPADSDGEDSSPEVDAPEKNGTVSFAQTMESLAPQLPSNITVPFYFICMLHLANERGLSLQGQEDLSDVAIRVPEAGTVGSEN